MNNTEIINYKTDNTSKNYGSIIVSCFLSLLSIIVVPIVQCLLTRITCISFTDPGSDGTTPSLKITFREE